MRLLRTVRSTTNSTAGVTRKRIGSSQVPFLTAPAVFFSPTIMASGHNPLGSLAYTSPTTTITQKAQKDWQFYQRAIIESEVHTGALLKEYKEGGTWRHHYKTWTDACVPLNISRSQVNKLIADHIAISSESPNEIKKQDEKALQKVEQARQEEPEKPRIKTADEVLADNQEKETKPPKPPSDPYGRVIPQRCIEIYSRSENELQPLITMASKLKSLFEDLQHKEDALFTYAKSHLVTGIDNMMEVFRILRDCKPELVCPRCDGRGGRCSTCFDTGMLSQHRWKYDVVQGTDPKLADKAKGIMNAHA